MTPTRQPGEGEVVHRSDLMGDFDEIWLCERPTEGQCYHVLVDVWSEDWKVRTIHEIRLV